MGVYVLPCLLALGLTLVMAGPFRRDDPPPSNSIVCASVYQGQCLDSYKYQCMGIIIPGICGNSTNLNYNGVENGALSEIVCCNGWLKVDIGK